MGGRGSTHSWEDKLDLHVLLLHAWIGGLSDVWMNKFMNRYEVKNRTLKHMDHNIKIGTARPTGGSHGGWMSMST